ncbi:MAG: hypothetical protein AAFT19_02295 [Pseudomonadota bacterium]
MSPHEYLEGVMLFCFSIGWYWSIAKMLRTRQALGKSVCFVSLITLGYGLGASSKLVYWHETGSFSPVTFLYAWNMLVCATDLFLVRRFSRAVPAISHRRPA